jgi:uncharacterized protein YfbU (UPF0304 family)
VIFLELSESERLILSNQYKILEELYPNQANEYRQHRKIVEDGYALDYDEISRHIYDELTPNDCTEVLDILSMHRALFQSAQALTDEPTITISFHGFDGNNETKQMAYTRFYLDELQRFTELTGIAQSSDYNSHYPTLERYRLMLDEWNQCADKNNLTREEIERIINVRIQQS